ncbi:hypothetical protein SAMN05428959_105191 [Duganella sp. CF517]|uniref:hypothetical protein n=1 Tax=Duganella sp. CF517 TaxID=1881038 RepID=UPI0008BB5905|nr:hypothetical protein [Duganella sp. CF517]SEO18087.1 hypothetical protein SAMN05428959_105191 [Duganella sp. CF517]
MISEFEELSDKIDQLAEMTNALRRENAQLRQANAAIVAENLGYQRRLNDASARIVALLEKVPSLDQESKPESDQDDAEQAATDKLAEKEDVR